MSTQPSPAPTRIKFGPFELDPATGELRKFGTRIRLQGQPIEILSILLSRPGEVVSREELQQRLWSGNTFVDFENGLNTAVNKLRQALSESADVPRFVETVPGRGYRFIGAVDRTPTTRPVLEMAGQPPERPPAREWVPARWRWPAGGLVLALTLSAAYFAGVWSGPGTPAARPRVQFRVTPPPGWVLNPPSTRQIFQLSPDGSRLAFSAMNANGGFDLFIRDLASLEVHRLPNSDGTYNFFWAPDSQSLFLNIGAQLRRVTLAGGNGHHILGPTPSMFFAGVLLGSDRVLLGGRRKSGLLPTAGGNLENVGETYRWPHMLPDGEHIIDIAFDAQARYQARIVKFGQSAPVRQLMETSSRVEYAPSLQNPGRGYLVYVRGGNLVAQPFDPKRLETTGDPAPIASQVYTFLPSGSADFSVSQTGVLAYATFPQRSQFIWTDRQGRKLSEISPGQLAVKYPRLSPDGRSVAAPVYDLEHGATTIWIFDTAAGTGRQMAQTAYSEDTPVWSPDSRAVVHNRARVEAAKLAVRNIGEMEREEALPPHEFQVATDWSSDGRYLVFTSTGFGRAAFEDNGNVFVIDMLARPDRKLYPLITTQFHEANAMFSPDARWLAFTSNESGRPELYLQRFRAGDPPALVGERFPLTRNGAQAIRWRRDGKEVFYLAFDGRIHAMPVTLGERPTAGKPVALFAISTAARAAIHGFTGFDVSPDGQRFVVPVVTTEEEPAIVITQNWESR